MHLSCAALRLSPCCLADQASREGLATAPTPPAAPSRPTFETTKVEGTDNVYIFRYQGHQSMFVVTKAGVIATDPIGLRRPQAVTTYIDEIKKVTNQPIKYVIYSHSHYDHDLPAASRSRTWAPTFIAHKNAKAQLQRFPSADVVMPDEVVDNKRTISLGGTTLELLYVGRNHSDNSLVMRLPKEKLIFTVDFVPIQSLLFRNLPDTVSPPEWEESLKRVVALDWERMIPGHPYAGGRLGTKQDVRDLIGYMQDLSAEVKKAAAEGKCTDTAMKEVKLPKYEKWGNYATYPADERRALLLSEQRQLNAALPRQARPHGAALLRVLFSGGSAVSRLEIDGLANQQSPGRNAMLKVYGRANSINVRKVLWMLDEIGLGTSARTGGAASGRRTIPYSARSIPWAWCR